MFRAGVVFKRRKKLRKAHSLAQDDLLDDVGLVEKTGKKMDKALSQKERERHDVCVLLRQQVATKANRDAIAGHMEKVTNIDAAAGPDASVPEATVPVTTRTEVSQSISFIVARNLGQSTWALSQNQQPDLVTRALCGLTQQSMLRNFCIQIANSRWFDMAILMVILINSVMMALDAPGIGDTHPVLKQIIVFCDELTLYIFTLECITKIIALGLMCGPGTYLQDQWNNLDAFVVVAGWLSVFANQVGECKVHGLGLCSESTSSTTKLGPIRTVRVLRPLRAINQLPGMKALVQTFLSSLPELRDSLVLCCFILVLSGIVGVQLYMGTLRQQCVSALATNGSGADLVADGRSAAGHLCALDATGEFGRCAAGLRCEADAGANPNAGLLSFDSLPVAMLVVFQAITLEGWTDIMYSVRSVKGVIHDIYFVLLIVVGSLFMTNLVVAVLVSNFVEQTDQEEANLIADADVEAAADAPGVKSLVKQVDATSYFCVRRICFYISRSDHFNHFMMFLILLNTVTMCLDNVISDHMLEIFNFVFTAIFLVEVLIKLLGFGTALFCKDKFNVFDAVIVALSTVEIILKICWNMEGQSLMVLRAFRLLRVFKLARSMKSLRKILEALFSSMRSILYLGVLLLIFMFVCALMGMSSFGCTEADAHMKPSEQKCTFYETGYYKDRMVRPNFSTFLYSMTTVFIIITGENWNQIMYQSVQKNGWPSVIYFIFVMITGNYVILKLFLAVLIEKFDTISLEHAHEEGEAKEPDLKDVTGVVADDPQSSEAATLCNERRVSMCRRPSRCSTSESGLSGNNRGSLRRMSSPGRKRTNGSIFSVDESEQTSPWDRSSVSPSSKSSTNHSCRSPLSSNHGAESSQVDHRGSSKASSQLQSSTDDSEESSGSHELQSRAASRAEEQTPEAEKMSHECKQESSQEERHQVRVSFAQDVPPLHQPPEEQNIVEDVPKFGSPRAGSAQEPPELKWTGSEGSLQRQTSPSARMKPTARDRVAGEGFTGSSLFILSPTSPLRKQLYNVISHPFFDSMVYGLIAVSAVTLALDSPEQKDPDIKHVFYVMDCVLSALFTLEAVMKILVYGFINGEHCYLRDGWNVLDLFVVITSIVNLIMASTGEGDSLAWMKALRAIRALRPLRMVSRSQGLKVVVNSIMQAAPAILDVLLVHLLFLVIFSILGVQLFKNKLYRCSCSEWCPERTLDPRAATAGQPISRLCQGMCPTAPAHAAACIWQRHPFWSFDNVGLALLTLFEVSTLEHWPEVMWLAVDGKSQSEGPEYNRNPFAVLFFIAFLFVMSFFILNLFVGVVIDKFTEVRNEMLGQQQLSEAQFQWIQTQKMLLAVRPRPLVAPHDDRWRQLALQLVDTKEFEFVIMGLIIANVLVMCTSSYEASPGLRRIQDSANYVFISFFATEAAIQIYALRPSLYFRKKSNTFDFIIVCGSIFSAATTDTIDATVLRVFRVARILRLVKSLKSLQKLFMTLVMSLPSLGHIGIMLLLLFFVYAVAGMALFGDIQIEGNMELFAMSKHQNFGSFYIAMMVLFNMSTGESWNGIMHDCFSGARCKEPPHEAECGNTVVAVIFFPTFMIIGSFVFVNLFIAVIIEKLFENSQDDDETSDPCVTISEAHLENFVQAWSRLAPKGHHFIPTTKLPELLHDVEPPLGFKEQVMRKFVMLRLLARLGILDHDGRVHFAEVLWRLASMVAGTDMRNVSHCDIVTNLDKQIMRALPLPHRNILRERSGSRSCIAHLAADTLVAVSVQSMWRAKRAKQKILSAVQSYSEQLRQTRGDEDEQRCNTNSFSRCDGFAAPVLDSVVTVTSFVSEAEMVQEMHNSASMIIKGPDGCPVVASRSTSNPPQSELTDSRMSEVLAMWECSVNPCTAACLINGASGIPCTALGRQTSPNGSPREFVANGVDETKDLLVMLDPKVRGDEELKVASERSGDGGTDGSVPSSADCRLPSAATLVKGAKRSLLKKCAL